MSETLTATETREFRTETDVSTGDVVTTERIEVESEVPSPVIPDVAESPPVGEHDHGDLTYQLEHLRDAIAEFEGRLVRMEEKQKAPELPPAPAPSPAVEGTPAQAPVEPPVPAPTTAPATETVISPTPEIQTPEKPAKKHAGFLF